MTPPFIKGRAFCGQTIIFKIGECTRVLTKSWASTRSMSLFIRGVWALILFQLFFLAALYVMLYSYYSKMQQGSVNVNIISVQRPRKSVPEDVDLPQAQELRTLKTYSQPSNKSSATTRIVRSTSTAATDTASSKSSTVSSGVPSRPFTTFLLIMVPILPSSFRNREVIRNTWYKGFTDGGDVMLRFAMGVKGIDPNVTKQLVDENNTYSDLIFFDNLKENRSVLTNKTLKLMQWAYENVNYSYFLKCDDDTYVFVKRMIHELKKRPTTKRFYYGVIDSKGRPKREGDPWPDLDWDLADTYLPYALGGGYILSSDLVSLIVEDAEYLRWRINEDTAVGSWLAPYQYERRNDKLICIMFFNKKRSKKCPEYHIMHLFFGVKRDELDKIFVEYSKKQ